MSWDSPRSSSPTGFSPSRSERSRPPCSSSCSPILTTRPVHAVLGNNDTVLVGALPDRLELELAGVRIAMVHDSGVRAGRERRVHRWFPDAGLVVFGHSHEPVDVEGVEGQRLFNPGSAVQRRRQPRRTVGRLELVAGRVVRHEIVPVR